MDSSKSPPLSDQRDEGEAVSLVPKEPPTAEEVRSDGPARDLDPKRDSSDQTIAITRNESDFYVGLPAAEPSIHVSPRSSGFNNDQLVRNRPPLGRRMFRNVVRFCFAVMIGVGATLAWQAHGDEAKEQARIMVRTWAPSLGWLLSDSMTKSPSEPDGAAGQTVSIPAAPVSPEDATSPASLSFTQREAPPATAISAEVAQQLEAMASDLAVVRRSIKQLTDKQERMAQNVAALQAAEQEIRMKMSSPPSSVVVPLPPRKNAPRVASPPAPAAQSSSAHRPAPISRPPLPLR